MVTQSRLVAAPSAGKNKFSDAEKQQKSNWLAVMVCVLCGVVSALQVVKVSIAAPFLISDLSLGHSTIGGLNRKSTRLNSSHVAISYAVFCLIRNKLIK